MDSALRSIATLAEQNNKAQAHIRSLETHFQMADKAWNQVTLDREAAEARIAELNVNIEHLTQFGADYCTKIAELEAAYAKLLDQAESMSVLMQCPWKEGSDAEVAWRKQQDEIFNEFWDDDEVDARDAFKEKT
tara:strand:- start:342 stop:743 length:402 start_codon:yes stop_codon:yes gene_type:complete